MATPTEYNINQWLKGVNGFGLPFCTNVYSATLVANTEETLTVPGTAAIGNVNSTNKAQWVAVFSYEPTKLVWVAVNATAAVPAGAALAATTSELLPPAKVLNEGDVIHVISAAGSGISIALYRIEVK